LDSNADKFNPERAFEKVKGKDDIEEEDIGPPENS